MLNNVGPTGISIKPQFTKNVKCFFKKKLWPNTRGKPIFLPTSKDVGLQSVFLDEVSVFQDLRKLGKKQCISVI